MTKQICEKCKQNPISVHYRETVNGVTREWHLCAECAQKMGIGKGALFAEEWMKPFSLFSPTRSTPKEEGEACPSCGMSLSRIRREGKFGCSVCYDTFSPRLDMAAFVGRGYRGGRLVEKPMEEKPKKQPAGEDRLSLLRKQLKEALQEENYEQAAVLRDQIRGEEAK